MQFDKTAQEQIDEILGRWLITDLREQTDDDLALGEEYFYKAEKSPVILEQGETNFIRWWKIESGGKEYGVRRFENFVFCSCPAFFFKKRMCKHAVITTRFFCKRCHVLQAPFGGLCYDCEMETAHFLSPTPKRTWNPTSTPTFK